MINERWHSECIFACLFLNAWLSPVVLLGRWFRNMNYSCTTQNGSCVDDDQLYLEDSNKQFIIYFGIRVTQATVAIIGNLLTLIIISKLKERFNGHIIMVYLAVSDILVCCMLPMSYIRNSSIINEKYWKNFCVISEYLYTLTMSYSVVSYITASIDRYVELWW